MADSRGNSSPKGRAIASTSREKHREARRQRKRERQRRALWPLLAAAVVVALLFLGVYPVRTYLSQRASLSRASHQLDVLQQENARLADQITKLQTDSEIERMAREEYNFVRPGEEAYAVLPAPPPLLQVPAVWPFTQLAANLLNSG